LKIANLYLPTSIWCPGWGDPIGISQRSLASEFRKRVPGYRITLFAWSCIWPFQYSASLWQMDGQTHDDSI